MKLRLASLFIAALVAAPALADDMDLSKIKCKDFIAADKDKVSTIMTWLEGYYTDEDSPPILYGDKMAKDAKSLTDYCNAHGDDDMIKAADTVMPVD